MIHRLNQTGQGRGSVTLIEIERHVNLPQFTYLADLGLVFDEAFENARWARRLTAAVSFRKIKSNSSG